MTTLAEQLERLAEENQRLRDALEVAAEALAQEQFHGSELAHNCDMCKAHETAIAALKAGEAEQ